MPDIDIQVKDKRFYFIKFNLKQFCRQVVAAGWQKKNEPAEISVVLTSDEMVRKLNKTYRHKDKPTNVLTFATGTAMRQADRWLAGDIVIALPSSGVHSNGFSLVRKVFDVENADLNAPVEALGGKSLGEELLTPTKIYVKPVLALLKEVAVRGISHITGGGFYENIPRSIPDGLGAKIDRSKIRVLPIFDLIAEAGNVSERDMFNTYNMGVGIVVAPEDAEKALKILRDYGEDAYIIGEIEESTEKITIV